MTTEAAINLLVVVGLVCYLLSLGLLAYVAAMLGRARGWPAILTWGILAREFFLFLLYAFTVAVIAGALSPATRATARWALVVCFLLLPLANIASLGRWLLGSAQMARPRDDATARARAECGDAGKPG